MPTTVPHYPCPPGVSVEGEWSEAFGAILNTDALSFLAHLHRNYNATRLRLLARRETRQREIDEGQLPDFLPETASIRADDWEIAPIPADLQDRRVEITGPSSDRKMVINALNSGAKCFLVDFEDANSPTFANSIQGQVNLFDAIRRTIDFTSPDGKQYTLQDKTAVLIARPRGWHLLEKHILVDGEPMSGALVDFGLYVFHNAKELLHRNSGPYFYLPKLESHLEARLWNDVFCDAERYLGLNDGTIKATVLIETILAAFEMDEILYELRNHVTGLNCGRWDYIFSYIKRLRNHPDYLLPNRTEVTMTVPFMRAYSLLTIQTCHRRKAFAMGGMAAQIPVKDNPVANEEALAKVRADKEREVQDGHDGTWVAHPALVPIAMAVFDEAMPTPNQIFKKRDDVHVTAADLLEPPTGHITEEGLRTNVRVGLEYIEAWLRGYGAVPIFNLMEDAATAEISRTQIWQWIHHPRGILEDGRKVDVPLFRAILREEVEKIRNDAGIGGASLPGHLDQAIALFDDLSTREDYVEFLTLPGYELL